MDREAGGCAGPTQFECVQPSRSSKEALFREGQDVVEIGHTRTRQAVVRPKGDLCRYTTHPSGHRGHQNSCEVWQNGASCEHDHRSPLIARDVRDPYVSSLWGGKLLRHSSSQGRSRHTEGSARCTVSSLWGMHS